jgi:RNA polymerase sigma factor (TIGR02999 family)
MSDVTRILDALAAGDSHAADDLLPLVYAELRRLAARKLAREKPGQTLDATALVHEAYLRLVGGGAKRPWAGRGHFFAAAAEAMRRILVDRARRRRRDRHGGGRGRVALTDAVATANDDPDAVLDLDAALTRLASEDGPAAAVAQLRVFAGLSVEEAAATLGQSRPAAYRHWTYARAWLRDALGEKPETNSPSAAP